jgi:RNA polymerase sigma factor for flagellar operon FliA
MMHRATLSYQTNQTTPRLTDDEVVRTYAHILDRVARRLAARTANTVTPGDLWSAGALGLIDAYHRFDVTRAVKFESFAEHRVRGAMIDELREMDHLPRRLRADTDRVRKGRIALGNTLGREPTSEELATHLGLDVQDLDALDSLSQPAVPLSPELQLAGLEMPPDDSIDHSTAVRRLTQAIEKLTPRLSLLLSLHYVEGLTYKEIALALEVSEARVCQLHAEAVKKLKSMLTEGQAANDD